MRAGSPVPISWCVLPGWMSPCTPPTANAQRGICRGRAHRNCGGRRLRRPRMRPAAVPRITPTTASWRPSTPATTARTRPWRWSAKSCAAAITPCGSSAMPPWRCQTPDHRKRLPEMRCVRALPITPLMPAASSRKVLPPPRCWVDLPERLSGRTPSPARTSGTPSIITSPDHCPWTQIRLGAGTRNDISRATLPPGRQQMT